MGIIVITAIIAVIVTLAVSVPVTANLSVKKKTEKDCSETKDHRFERRRQRYSGGSFGRGRCGCSSVFYKGRTADRKGSFLSSYLKRRKNIRYFRQFY